MPPRLRTCDLNELARLVLRTAGPAASIAIAGTRAARIDTLVSLLGHRMPTARFGGATAYSSDDVDEADVRLWMDDPGGMWAHLREEASAAGPVGTWTTTLATEDAERLADEEAHERALRDRADAVFAAVEGFDDVIHLRFMADYGGFALWDDHNDFLGELEGMLPIPAELAQRISGWAKDAHTATSTAGRRRRGRALADELQRALGRRYRVDYRG